MTIGERIKEVRKNEKLTQQEFADRLNLKRNTVGSYEVNVVEPSDRTIKDICDKFGVREAWLRTGEGKPYPERGRLEELSYMAGRFLSNEPTEFQRRFATMTVTPLKSVLLKC